MLSLSYSGGEGRGEEAVSSARSPPFGNFQTRFKSACVRPGGESLGQCRVRSEIPKPKSQIPNKSRILRTNCKTPAAFNFQGPFPLTTTLSLRERENQGPRCNNSKRFGLSNAPPTMLPLPGRGQG